MLLSSICSTHENGTRLSSVYGICLLYSSPNNGTALDILERSPGVTVDRNNNVLAMNGKQGVMVMLNGKLSRIPMNSLLQMLAE